MRKTTRNESKGHIGTIDKFTCGVEIYMAAGREDRAEVRDRNERVTFTGTYAECVAHVKARGLRRVRG